MKLVEQDLCRIGSLSIHVGKQNFDLTRHSLCKSVGGCLRFTASAEKIGIKRDSCFQRTLGKDAEFVSPKGQRHPSDQHAIGGGSED